MYISNTAVDKLRFEIIKLAIVDYHSALKWLRKHPAWKIQTEEEQQRWNEHHHRKVECEMFFNSSWFGVLCDIDGQALMKTIRVRFYNCPIRWRKYDL